MRGDIGMFYMEPRVTQEFLYNLSLVAREFEYANRLIKDVRQSNIPDCQVLLYVENNRVVGYMLFKVCNIGQLYRIFEDEGVGDLSIPKGYDLFFYIDTVDIAKPYQKRGIGRAFLERVLSNRLPVILQATEESEDYWRYRGFRELDHNWYIMEGY